jgi:hypothetical protein
LYHPTNSRGCHTYRLAYIHTSTTCCAHADPTTPGHQSQPPYIAFASNPTTHLNSHSVLSLCASPRDTRNNCAGFVDQTSATGRDVQGRRMWSRNLQHVGRTCGDKLMLILRDDLWLRKLMLTSPLDLCSPYTIAFMKSSSVQRPSSLVFCGKLVPNAPVPRSTTCCTQRGYDNGVTASHRTARFAMQVARRFLRQPSPGFDYRNQ